MRIALKRIKTLLIWVGLLVFGGIVLLVFGLPAFVAGVVSKFWKKKVGEGFDEFSKDLRAVNIIIDILGAYTIFNWLWFLFKTKDGYKFAQNFETVSYVLWRNYKANTLIRLGPLLYRLINGVDPGHFDIFEIENQHLIEK